jgi:integral membrane protein (TIGR01906 family)
VSAASSVRPSSALLRVAVTVASGLCVLAFPFALVGLNLRGVALNERFYLSEFARYRIGAQTGLSDDELRRVADAFIAYFQGSPGRMNVQIARGGALQPLFNERELAHMEDVQVLMQGILRLQDLALANVVAYGLAGVVLGRYRFLPLAARVLLLGGGLTLALFVVLGALALTDFSALFLQFHLVSFANDLWLLDPTRDYLIRLFPQGFFQDAALQVAGRTVVQALGLTTAGLLALWLGHRRATAGAA